jgi:quercetin dioxygenase-like cupin family protein
MPVVHHAKVASETFKGGATYQTLVGGQGGSPVCIGIQTSPPGYKTAVHSHPYMETITVLEGQGEAWMEDSKDLIPLEPGVTLVLLPNTKHWFRATGDAPLKTYWVHASPQRTVYVQDSAQDSAPDSAPQK